MAITVEEAEYNQPKTLTGKSGNRVYIIKGVTPSSSADIDAFNAMIVTVPPNIGQFLLMTQDSSVEEVTEEIYLGYASYSIPDRGSFPENSFQLSFDIYGDEKHITQSINTVSATYNDYLTNLATISFHGAIGAQKETDGSYTYDGLDIIFPKMELQVNYVYADESVTEAFINDLAHTVGKVNDDTFYGFPSGELLFTKASGQRRKSDDQGVKWDINYSFTVSENRTFVECATPPQSLVVEAKRGWDYLWIYYDYQLENFGDSGTTKNRKIKVPYAAFVEQVYPYVSFSALNIGGAE